MKTARLVSAIFLLLGVTITSPLFARTHDHLFANPFDTPPDAPASDAEAARFLTQATFGPTQTDIAWVRAVGYSEWIEQQLGKTATTARPTVEQVIAARTGGGQSIGQTQRNHRWFWQATYAPDQLRQRMAFALSQIFVVSDQSSTINSDIIPMTEYYDVLTRDAFSSYRTVLGDVTSSPTMGKYLSYFHNQKPSSTTQPDENYAREVMQLFSIGLIELNLDFSPVLSSGSPIPTYDQTVITHTAKIFTGFTYSDAPVSPANFYGGALTNAGSYNPMACWGTELFASNSSNMRHDITGDDGTTGTSKTVLAGLTIPAGQTCAADVGAELDIVAGHANVAPFISRQLIQRFVTSNPSPAYIQRVAQVFEDNGVGDRGDLGDVVKAILLDTEARNPPLLNSYGKLREPLLRLIAMWRAWNAVAPVADAYGEIKMAGTTNFASSYGQAPLGAPTVFNFYTPDYQQAGTFADAGLYSPEFQITSEASTYSTSNSYYNFTANAYLGMSSPPVDRPLIDLSTLTVNVATPSAMVDTINANMLYGSMSANMHTTLTNLITGLASASASEKAWSAIYLTMLSPEYAAQR